MYGEVLRTSIGDVASGHPLALDVGPYGDVRRTPLGDLHGTSVGDVPWTLHFHALESSVRDVIMTSAGDILRSSAGDIPWRYIEDHMETFGDVLRKSSGRNFAKREVVCN